MKRVCLLRKKKKFRKNLKFIARGKNILELN